MLRAWTIAALTMLVVVPSAHAAPDQPRWQYFETRPPLTDSEDTRILGCFPELPSGGLTSGCDADLRSPASPEPWDEPDDSDADGPDDGTADDSPPTYTTLGDAADTGLAGDHPFAADPSSPLRPTSIGQREYRAPWTDAWRAARCNPSNLSGGPSPSGGPDVFGGANANDVNASIVNLFAAHNRLHDWSYEHGFRAERMEDADRIVGRVQSDADGSDSPAFAARDAAYLNTPPDGTADEHVFPLWRPRASLWYGPCVDGAFDGSVVAHAYGHAIVDRMAAGPIAIGGTPQAVLEGLADLLAAEFTGDPVIGAYVAGNATRGVRNYSMAASPLNFSDGVGYDRTAIDSPHPASEILSATGRDIRAAIGPAAWAEVLFDSLPLLTASPTMLDARDALLAAAGASRAGALWTAFARRGMGTGASSVGFVPSFVSPAREDESTVTFAPTDPDTGDAVVAQLFVGHYAAGATPVADTDPATALDAAFDMVPGTYDFLVRAPGHGMQRVLGRAIPATSDVTLAVALPTNQASTVNGATASGDGTGQANLFDEDEGTGWAAPGVGATQVIVDLAGTEPHVVDRVNVSALVQSPEGDEQRFTALRWFDLRSCVASSANANCTAPDAFDDHPQIYSSEDDAFPGDEPRPVAPQLNLRTFDVTGNPSATHLLLRVIANQCVGSAPFQDETLSSDPARPSDCTAGANRTDQAVRAAELQAFSRPPVVEQTSTPRPTPAGAPPGDPAAGDPPPGAAPPPGTGPPGLPLPGAGARDLTAPVISGLRLASRRVRRSRGTTIRFRLTEAARVTLTFARRRGRRYVRAARVRVTGRAGANRVRFRRRSLRPGRYRVTAVAVDAAGNRSQRRRATFRLLRR